jgi:pseudouridine synthase
MKSTAYLLLTVVLFFSACAEPSPLVFKGVQSIKIDKASLGKNSFKAEFAYQNPNSFGLVLNKLDCNVYINDQLFTQYKLDTNFTIPANAEFLLPANMEIELSSLLKNSVDILLNKPKDYICTANDPEGRKTVLDIIKNATTQRMFPVGRLDRNTTGVLVLTNDGDLAQKLTHPSYEIKKIYEVTLDKPVTKADMEAIAAGVTLEDGFIAADAVSYVGKERDVIGIEIHSGRNRIVRRIFEHLGYDVRHLDRVMFANLTKKNVDRGKWRFLSEKEVRLLKFLNKSFTRSASK